MKLNCTLLISSIILTASASYSQCSFTGLPTTICETEAPQALTPSGAGLFYGAGISGYDFDPLMAGPGMHTITYEESDPTIYTIDQAGIYAPIPSVGTSVFLTDDDFTPPLPIGFSFNFFGNIYTDFHISSNGFLCFTAGTYNGCCSGATLPLADDIDNIIAWGWNDLYPPGNGSITYETIGTAPNRMLLVSFNDIWHCCSGPAVNTSQVILYETTNIIEIHSAEITSDGSLCTQGIENIDGTIAYATPGRNSTTWTATNDYVAFIPNLCEITQDVEVYPSPSVIGIADISPACVGDQVTFTGSGADSYTWDSGVVDGVPYTVNSSASFVVTGTESVNGCSRNDTVNLVVNPNPTISLSANDVMYGSDGSINLTILSGIAPFQFDWDNDGTGDNDDNNDLYGVNQGDYTVTITDGNGCMASASASVGSQLGLDELSGVQFTIHPNPSDGKFNVTAKNVADFGVVKVVVVNALGQRLIESDLTKETTQIDISEQQAGIYFLKIITEKGTSVVQISKI